MPRRPTSSASQVKKRKRSPSPVEEVVEVQVKPVKKPTAASRKRAAEAAAALLDPNDPYAGIDVADVSALLIPDDADTEKPKKVTARRSTKVAKRGEGEIIVEEEPEPEVPLPEDAEWISASATRNYLMKDPCLDWFKHCAGSNDRLLKLKQEGEDNFTSFIMEKGNEFEKGVVKLMMGKFGSDFVNMGGNRENARDPQKHRETVDAMKAGVPILFSAVLHHEPSRTFGIPDLIVRVDYISKVVSQTSVPPKEVSLSAPLLAGEDGIAPLFHYRIVDIKFHSLGLRANGIHLLNAGSIPAYKSQMWVYNRALATAQGYDPRTAYLLGRKWSYTSKDETYSGESCFERLGTIDFVKIDSDIPRLTDKAVAWLRDVHTHGHEWDIFKPRREEMYVNMCNNSDWPWHRAKKEVALEVGEISLLWNCGVKQRNIAHANGIMRYDDPRISAKLVGINGEYTSRILDKILEVNHPACTDVILSAKLNLPPIDVELVVDFEGVSNITDDMSELPLTGGSNSIFMIGVGYVDTDTKDWVYRAFVAHDFGKAEERRIALEFCDYLATFEGKLGLLHWSHYEYTQWNNIAERYDDVYEKWLALNADWVDLLKLFKEEPIVVKGAYGFGLKEIVGAMYKHGLIKISYADSLVSDGADAIVQARRAEQEAREQGISMHLTSTMKGIQGYNEIDCRVLHEVLEAIRLVNANQ